MLAATTTIKIIVTTIKIIVSVMNVATKESSSGGFGVVMRIMHW